MLKIYVNGEDKTVDLIDYNGTVTGALNSTTGVIEVGYYKPISDLYFEVSTVNATSETLEGYYYAPTETELTLTDKSKNLTRSGFVQWDRSEITPAKTTRNNLELYWYTFKASGDMGNLVFNGIGLVLSDDNDLKEDYPDILESLPSGANSFVKFHKSSKDKIIQDLNNSNIRKASTTLVRPTRINEWDLLNINELKLVSKYNTLGLIFKWLSDEVDDKYLQDSKYNFDMAASFMLMPSLSLDIDDDGQEDSYELDRINSSIIQRQ